MTKTSRIVTALAVIAGLAFIDQLSKWYVIEMFFRPRSFDAHGPTLSFMTWLTTWPQERFPFYVTEITSFFNFVMVWNKGVSFGMFASGQSYMPYALMVMALGMTVFFVVWMVRAASLWAALPLALIIAGALSNVWDRARFGAVVDFLDFHIGGLHWPAFNIADSCIVVGVASLALHTVLSSRATDKSKTNALVDQA